MFRLPADTPWWARVLCTLFMFLAALGCAGCVVVFRLAFGPIGGG